MPRIPVPKRSQIEKSSRIPNQIKNKQEARKKVLFSFMSVDKNEYFNLDGTCQNWSADLFETMQMVSGISIDEITAGTYSGNHSPLRIHQHQDAKAPCKVPSDISLEDMWQIRISLSKGGIHGVFVENIFYVVWFDPLHNLYPDKNHGGLRKVIPPSTCCKDRDNEIIELKAKLEAVEKERDDYMELADQATSV